MLIGELIVSENDIGCGDSSQILETTKNIKQLQEISEKLNKKYGESSETNSRSFSVKIIDTKNVKDSLTKEDIRNLWR